MSRTLSRSRAGCPGFMQRASALRSSRCEEALTPDSQERESRDTKVGTRWRGGVLFHSPAVPPSRVAASREDEAPHFGCYDHGHASSSLALALLKTARASVFGCSVFGADGN